MPGPGPANQGLPFTPRNTFDSFVVGTSNNFAYAAAVAVAQAPGRSYSPLFLFGRMGLGKTHLLHAIGHYVSAHNRSARVPCVSSERFANEYLTGCRSNQLAGFRERYRETEVFLVDDVQFLAGQAQVQEEFFHTFNALHESQRQIVLTCDRPAGEIRNLEPRLVSRFDWGLVTELQPPDADTRLAILRKKAQQLRVELPEEIMNLLASRIRTNIRELEGALIRVASYTVLTGRELNLEAAEGLLHEESPCTICIQAIQAKVAEHFDIRPEDLVSGRRMENFVFPRQIAMFISRQLTKASLTVIGEAFGSRDHATVLRACRLVKDRMEVDPQVRHAVSLLEKQLTRGGSA